MTELNWTELMLSAAGDLIFMILKITEQLMKQYKDVTMVKMFKGKDFWS